MALTGLGAQAAPLILNEYNAVSAGSFLNGGDAEMDSDGGLAADTTLGRLQGNGGDWFELVVLEDGLDLRGWQFEIYDDGAPVPDAVLVVSQAALFQSLAAGTILTIAEDQPADPSYDPGFGDYWIALQSTAGGDATYLSQSAFDVSNNDWQLRVRDASGVLVFGPGGEGVSPAGGIGSTEVFRLEEDPSNLIDAASECYDDGSRGSSYGTPNGWGSMPPKVQRFDALRGGLPATSQCDETDRSFQAFDPNRVLVVEISMDPADWDAVRTQSRSLLETFGGHCGDRPPPSPFEFYPGDVTIDGETISNVGIRKKGFFGSLDRGRPSLKIDLTEYVPDQRWSSLERLTLNNSKQDPSFIDQCLGYGLFRAAGLPASRCNFARVTVNGDDLGLYVHVESIKDPFLARNFGNAAGKLYEGSVADFREHFIGAFEAKNGGDGSELDAFEQALQLPDDELLAGLAPFIDIDTFVTFWAMEGLVGHWDGYAGNSNNFWVYVDPETGFQFLPWSLDDIFGRGNPFFERGEDLAIAPSVYDRSALVHRLWELPGFRTAYVIRINELLDEVWDEAALQAEVGRMQALIEPITGDLSAQLRRTRDFIDDRAFQVAEDFGSSPPASLGAPLGDRSCLEVRGNFSATFETEWGSIGQAPFPAVGTVAFVADQEPPLEPDVVSVFAGAGVDSGTGFPSLQFITLNFPPASPALTVFALNLEIHPEQYAVGGPFALDDAITNVIAFIANPTSAPTPIIVGEIPDVTLTLDEASMTSGGLVSGKISGTLAYWIPAPEPGSGVLAAAALTCVAALVRRRQVAR